MRLTAATIALAVLLPVLPASASAPEPYERPGRNELVTVGNDGVCPAWYTQEIGISADARYAAFAVRGEGMAPGDDHEATKVYVRDRDTGQVEVGSVSSDGEVQAPGSFGNDPVLSADGRYLAFASSARNLAAGKTTGVWDIFLRDRVAGTTELVSVPDGGGEMNNHGFAHGVSDDGRFVLFSTRATNVTPESAETRGDQAYLRDRELGTTTLVSRAEDGTPGHDVHQPALSGDGSTVVYLIRDEDWMGRDPDDHCDFCPPLLPTYVYAYDVESGEATLASPSWRGDRPNSWAEYPSVSRDGRYVAFMSDASDLIPRASNRAWDAYVHDRVTARNERVSVGDLGAELALDPDVPWNPPISNHLMPHISPNGRWVVFLHSDEKVGGSHGWNTREAILHDRWTRTSTLVSRRTDTGERTNMWTHLAYVADDGSTLFRTAGRLHPDDCGLAPAYVRDRGPDTGAAWLEAVSDGDEVDLSGAALFGSVRLADAHARPAVEGVDEPLRAAEVHYRPDRADLVVRIMPAFLPVIAPVVPAPIWWVEPTAGVTTPLLYGFELTVDGVRHEVRILGAGRDAEEALDARIELHRCAVACELVTTLDGSYGTVGHETVAAIPLGALDLAPGTTITDMRAYTGPAATGELDGHGTELALGDAVVPTTSVAVAVGSANAEPPAAAFSLPASASAGTLHARIPLDQIPTGAALWARACIAETCGTTQVPAPTAE